MSASWYVLMLKTKKLLYSGLLIITRNITIENFEYQIEYINIMKFNLMLKERMNMLERKPKVME